MGEVFVLFKDTNEAATAFPLSKTTWHAANDALICASLEGTNKQAVSVACADGTSALRLKEILDILSKASVKNGKCIVITDDTNTSANIVAGLGITTITAADVS
jgi:hypothetical protein|tara:strand:+ start:112 stop:423 length:312 start_codon:yes stop_codon:yes gene_type:complete